MATTPVYIPAFSIEDVLLDKDTGAPLSGGKVYFFRDSQRSTPKPVYQITGAYPVYTYVPLPNPVILSSIGTFEDAMGNPVIPYFYPYDANLDPDYYFVRVTSSDDVPQFTRENVPFNPLENNSEVLNVITNELSNPQFSVVNFDTSSGDYIYSIGTVTDQVINIAPDWDLVVSCASSGTVTLNQTTPSGAENIVTNPGTILVINSSGLSKLWLRQRIVGSPNLWGLGFISATFVAKNFGGSPVDIKLYYSQSNGDLATTPVPIVEKTLASSVDYAACPGNAPIRMSDSINTFPTAYIDIYFDVPRNVQIGITSVMATGTGETNFPEIIYDQEPNPRQIDHLYHYAYPIIPIGTIIDYAGFTIPQHYLDCDAAAYNRITYQQLFNTLTKVETVTLTTGLDTFTVVSSADYWIGMAIEGSGVPASTTISNIVGTTITMSNLATSTGASDVRFFSSGAGDGSTTFNVPDLRGYVIAGVHGTIFPSNSNGVGLHGGFAEHTLLDVELPPHQHSYNSPVGGNTANGYPTAFGPQSIPELTGSGPGASTPFSVVQPTALYKKCIRFE